MPKGAKSKGIGKRNTGGGKSKKKAHKQAVRSGFETRHIDQVLRLSMFPSVTVVALLHAGPFVKHHPPVVLPIGKLEYGA